MAQGRKLNLKARAERQAQTRQRIVEAAVGLHTTVGPVRTTITAIAERAGVRRQTVYSHFPDERSLFVACSAHVRSIAPPPEVAPWQAISDPEQRLRTALPLLYSYFRRTAGGWSTILRDAEVAPLVREMAATRRLGYLQEVRDVLAQGWSVGKLQQVELVAGVGLAVDFRTWETLTAKQGLDDERAARMMADLVVGITASRLKASSSR